MNDEKLIIFVKYTLKECAEARIAIKIGYENLKWERGKLFWKAFCLPAIPEAGAENMPAGWERSIHFVQV